MIKIDVDTRYWKIPKDECFLGVESDDKVKILQFELSKNEFYAGLNFTDCNCFINYKNEDNDTIPYGITDMELQEDGTVTFTWQVSRGATIFKGNTFAILCAKKVREDGTITNEWNSRIGSFTVSKGLEPSSSIVEVPEIDIISQLLLLAQQANTNAQTNIEQSNSLLEKAEGLGYLKEDFDVLEARMDQFTSLKEGSTAGDAELQDIRVGTDGKTYDTAGDAVRGQVSKLKGDLDELDSRISESIVGISSALIDGTDIKEIIPITLVQGRYYHSANAITYDNSTKFVRSELIDISIFDNVTFYIPYGYKMLAYAFDSNSGTEYTVVKSYIGSWETGEQTLSFNKKDGANYLMLEITKVDSSAFTPSSVTDTLLYSERKSFIKPYINKVGAFAYLSGGSVFSFEEYIKANDTWVKVAFPQVGTLYIKGFDMSDIVTVPCSAQEFTVSYNNALVVDVSSGFVSVKKRSDVNENDIVLIHVLGGYIHGLIENQYYMWKNSSIDEDSFPSYYTNYLTSKISTVNNISAEIGSNGDAFVFITDTHDSKNMGNSPMLIKNICYKTGVDKVFHGGDIINLETTKSAVYDKVASYFGQFYDNAFYFYPIAGNHEYNNPDAGTSEEEVAVQLTADNIYPFIAHGLSGKINAINSLVYCIDNDISKIRYVVVSCDYNSNITSTLKQNAINMINNAPNSYGVVVISHVGVSQTGINPSATDIINALDNLTGAYPIAFINGHCHRDEYTVSSGGVPIISTTTDAYASDKVYTRTKGTVTEQAFDVVQIDKINRKIYMTRIGAGADRVFDF